ncbi:hypothetical protein CMV_023689 [Castanea mollissima]|uniref:Uncharacterized protein n=1 Tax=Castanea mollissima TaxID=60419 RepID=A0A8J4QPL6_9ROSI|nr:hypothetical protein CMV_023689 [Castanea mollissima]
MPSNPTVSASSATTSNDYHCHRRPYQSKRDFGLITPFSLTQVKFIFSAKSISPIVFSASREKHNQLAVGLLVSSDEFLTQNLIGFEQLGSIGLNQLTPSQIHQIQTQIHLQNQHFYPQNQQPQHGSCSSNTLSFLPGLTSQTFVTMALALAAI